MNASVPGSGHCPPAPPPFPVPPPPRKDGVPSCGFIADRVQELINAGGQGRDLYTLEVAVSVLRGEITDPVIMQNVLEKLRGMLGEKGLSRRTKNTLLLAIARIAGWVLLGGP